VKAAVCTGWGPPEVVRVVDVKQPKPSKGQVRIRVVASSVTASETMMRGLKFPRRYRILVRIMFGLRPPGRPLILGMVFSGVVESVGRKVTAFRPGDEVFGLSQWKGGCNAEYVCVAATGLIAARPANLSHAEAAALPYGGLLASVLVSKASIKAGQRVLVYGASGAIGTATVQLARHLGARVTGVCSTTNLALVQSLGAESVVDYTREDFTASGERYDAILDAVGKRKSAQAMVNAERALAPGGTIMSIDGFRPWLRAEDLSVLKRLAESGEFRPVIDRTYPLEQIVEAHRYVDEGHKRGNVIVTIDGSSAT
jgi:NADPH:quinone reductase-like Zn-dependent oxidoreductase